MKRVNNIYNKITSLDVIIDMYEHHVKVNTRNKKKIQNFENNYCSNIAYIKESLLGNKYCVGKYNIFLVHEPKLRIIMSQDVIDKIVNHLVAKYFLVNVFDKSMLDRNCATRIGKGTHYALRLFKNDYNSLRLTLELGKGYSERNLKNMRKFYLLIEKGHAVRTELTWTHYRQLLCIDDFNKIDYYCDLVVKYNLSYRQLCERIKNNEYDRLSEETKNNLINKKDKRISDFIKNPIIIRNSHKHNFISEKLLKQLILEDLDNFMKELGEGFCYIENEYKIKIGDRYNYIDLLLFNYKYNCFVVIELKITELKSEYIGQIEKYMNYIDKNVKSINQDKTIGIIICKKDNKFIMEYVSDDRVYRTLYVLN